MAKKPLAPTVTSPATMGDEMAHPVVNKDTAPSIKRVKKQGSKSGAPDSTTGIRKQVVERLGAKYAPQPPMSVPNAVEAQATGRNVRVLPSSVGNRDFWYKRQYGQNTP